MQPQKILGTYRVSEFLNSAMPSVFWLAAYNPLLTWASLLSKLWQMTAELLLSYFQIHLQLREGHALLHMVWDFVWELNFQLWVFKRNVQQQLFFFKETWWGGERVHSQKLRCTCFSQSQGSWENSIVGPTKLSCWTEITEFYAIQRLFSPPIYL